MDGYAQLADESDAMYAQRLLAMLKARDAVELPELPASLPADGAGLEEAEAMLVAKSAEKQSPMVLELLKGLQQCAVYTDSPNFETNRKLWNAYAQNWSSDAAWVSRMASHVAKPSVSCVGEEWSDTESLKAVLQDWLFPELSAASASASFAVAEVGSGGGRVAAEVAKVQTAAVSSGAARPRLVCFDISEEMLKAAQKKLAEENLSAEFQLVRGDADYPAEFQAQFDLVYSFDVFVHMDLHQMRHTLKCIHGLLRPSGRCFLSFANLLAPEGWRRFARQSQYSVGGFYFVSPDIVRCLLQRGGFKILKMSQPRAGNTYLNRDLLVLAEKPSAS